MGSGAGARTASQSAGAEEVAVGECLIRLQCAKDRSVAAGHLIVHAVAATIQALDRSFQRHPRRVLRNYNQLCVAPREVLESEEAIIKPRRLYVLATIFAIVITFLTVVLVEVIWNDPTRPRHRPPISNGYVLAGLALSYFVSIFLIFNHWM